MPPATADALSPEEAALLLALLPPPAVLQPHTAARPLGHTPERVALAWLRRTAEALVAALLGLLLLFQHPVLRLLAVLVGNNHATRPTGAARRLRPVGVRGRAPEFQVRAQP